MSKKETNSEEQKIVTKYDRKIQKRKEEKEKEKREKRMSTIISAVVVVALLALVLSFPIRTHMSLNETYVTVNGEKISKVEYDYNYYQVKETYLAQNGSMLSAYGGMDITSDFSKEMYSDTMTWGDYFDELTMQNITRSKALKAEADAAGFTYDTTEDYKQFEEDLKNAAESAGVSQGQYIKDYYGPYATKSRISEYLKESMVTTAYYNQKMEEFAPAEEEIQSYYNENQDNYDSVNYRITTINAELPTEPTALADATTQAAAETAEGTETVYQPSEAEIEKAMADAKLLAEEALVSVVTEGELRENAKKAGTVALIRDWLFDSARKAGDTTVLEDVNGNKYYVLAFEERYLDDTPSVDVRVAMLENQDGQTFLDEWKSGEATEESFAAMCDKYTADKTVKGGLYEEVTKTGMNQNLANWMFAKERVTGDTEIIKIDDTYTYVGYFLAKNRPEWMLNIENTLINETMAEYIEEISGDCTIDDPKGNLKYIEIRKQEEAAAVESTEVEAVEATE